MNANAKKEGVVRWRGVMGDRPFVLRCAVAAVLAVAGAAFAFMQLGFISVNLPDGTSGYAVLLLAVIALGALLFGPAVGAVLGVVAGTFLLLHAKTMPLDYYELMYVTPMTSVAMLGVCGLLIGILFGLALRGNPSQVRRIVGIVVACVIVSWLYSLGFLSSVTATLIGGISGSIAVQDGSTVSELAATTARQLGDVRLQAWTTAFAMSLACFVGDAIARWIRRHEGTLGMRLVIGSWLAVAVTLTFLMLAAASFAVGTVDALHDAQDNMRDEVGYLNTQMHIAEKRATLAKEVLDAGELKYDKVDERTMAEFADYFEDGTILEGYDKPSDGIVLELIDEIIYASDDESMPSGLAESYLTTDALAAIDRSIETGEMQRFIYVDPAIVNAVQNATSAEDLAKAASAADPSIAYVYAEHAFDLPTSTESEQDNFDVKAVVIRDADHVFAKRGDIMESMVLASLVLLAVFSLALMRLLDRIVARRIDEENTALAAITAGELDTRAEAKGTREFLALSDGINTTVDTLKGWIAEAESRMDAELAAARSVQESALPRTFPPFPDLPSFDIFASMDSAREVGGDFYDFFLVGKSSPDAGKVAFLMADVSGKGMPAALLMMKAKALLRDYVGSGMELGKAMTKVNAALCEGNEAGMFVTAWVGVLDYATGHVEYANAGHNPPLLLHDGSWEWMPERSGPMLGVFDLPYRAHSLECSSGDAFLLYTDGVTEAFDADENQYGEQRLLAIAEKSGGMQPRDMAEAVRADVAAHAQDAEQSDDITILALKMS